MTHLISSSLQPSSIPTYRRAWKLYRNFLFSTVGNPSPDFPNPLSDTGSFHCPFISAKLRFFHGQYLCFVHWVIRTGWRVFPNPPEYFLF